MYHFMCKYNHGKVDKTIKIMLVVSKTRTEPESEAITVVLWTHSDDFFRYEVPTTNICSGLLCKYIRIECCILVFYALGQL